MLYILGVTIFCVVLYYLFRVVRLLDVINKKHPYGIDEKENKTQATLLVLFIVGGLLYFFWYAYQNADRYLLPIASQHGVAVERMFHVTMGIILVVFVLTHVVLAVFVYKYRYKNTKRADFYHDNRNLEIVWTVLPAIVLSVLIFYGQKYWVSIMSEAPEDAQVVEIVGYQFAWSARYPGADGVLGRYDYRLIDAENRTGIDFSDARARDDFIPREIHLLKGKPVQFNIRALDVIHSFYLPHFRAQMYAIPGMATTFWFVPTKTTQELRDERNDPTFNYELACNKICGKGHFSMRHIVVVDDEEAYQAWRQAQKPWLEKNEEYLDRNVLGARTENRDN